MGLYRHLLWPLLRHVDAEASHNIALGLARVVQATPGGVEAISKALGFQDSRLALTWRGLHFRNPVGLAAGLDKNAEAPAFFRALGFGFLEVGTVTPRPQAGNAKPRMFRAPAEEALVNRLGFPSQGADAVARRLSGLRLPGTPLGVNIGKNAATPLAHAAEDYAACLETLYPHGDYFVVNVSSPNTEGLTSLQVRETLAGLLTTIEERRRALAGSAAPKPLLVKISPDLSQKETEDVVDVALSHEIEGLVAVNTSVDPGLRRAESSGIRGGLSGRPLRWKALEAVEMVRRVAPSDFFVIGAGGVFDSEDAWRMLQAGADLVQLYTGLVYQGPGVVASINRGLSRLREQSRSGTHAPRVLPRPD